MALARRTHSIISFLLLVHRNREVATCISRTRLIIVTLTFLENETRSHSPSIDSRALSLRPVSMASESVRTNCNNCFLLPSLEHEERGLYAFKAINLSHSSRIIPSDLGIVSLSLLALRHESSNFLGIVSCFKLSSSFPNIFFPFFPQECVSWYILVLAIANVPATNMVIAALAWFRNASVCLATQGFSGNPRNLG